jgi:hypothetical protein
MKCDSLASFLARTFVSLCLGREPKAKVETFVLSKAHTLDLQSSHFKMIMIHNSEVIMCDKKNSLNPLTQLWHKIPAFPIFNQKL